MDLTCSTFVGNTRTISQSSLQTFQEEMGKVLKDPYKVRITVGLFHLAHTAGLRAYR